jgi:hypothetical protein
VAVRSLKRNQSSAMMSISIVLVSRTHRPQWAVHLPQRGLKAPKNWKRRKKILTQVFSRTSTNNSLKTQMRPTKKKSKEFYKKKWTRWKLRPSNKKRICAIKICQCPITRRVSSRLLRWRHSMVRIRTCGQKAYVPLISQKRHNSLAVMTTCYHQYNPATPTPAWPKTSHNPSASILVALTEPMTPCESTITTVSCCPTKVSTDRTRNQTWLQQKIKMWIFQQRILVTTSATFKLKLTWKR